MTKKSAIGAALVAGLALFGAAPASAQESGASRFVPPSRGTSETYIVTLNGNVVLQPTFQGSDRASLSMFPSLSYRKSDEPVRFAAPDDGISISIIDTPTFRVGPVFRYTAGRYLQDDKLLFGLRKRGYDVEAGAFVEYWPLTFIRARAELRHGFREDSGLTGSVGVDAVAPVGKFVFSLGPRAYFGDQRYHDRFFGVRADEAAINNFVYPYRPGGGLTALGAVGAVTYQWNDTWSTTGYVNYRRLTDSVAKSPIVTTIGSRDQWTVGGRVSYSFAFTPWW